MFRVTSTTSIATDAGTLQLHFLEGKSGCTFTGFSAFKDGHTPSTPATPTQWVELSKKVTDLPLSDEERQRHDYQDNLFRELFALPGMLSKVDDVLEDYLYENEVEVIIDEVEKLWVQPAPTEVSSLQ